MNVMLWVLQILLALVFLAAGLMKLARPQPQPMPPAMAWTEDFSPGSIRLIGLAEVLGGLGLFLPAVLGTLPQLTGIAALALTVLMLGGMMTHLRRHEPVVPALVLAILALLVFVGRLWIVPLGA